MSILYSVTAGDCPAIQTQVASSTSSTLILFSKRCIRDHSFAVVPVIVDRCILWCFFFCGYNRFKIRGKGWTCMFWICQNYFIDWDVRWHVCCTYWIVLPRCRNKCTGYSYVLKFIGRGLPLINHILLFSKSVCSFHVSIPEWFSLEIESEARHNYFSSIHETKYHIVI